MEKMILITFLLVSSGVHACVHGSGINQEDTKELELLNECLDNCEVHPGMTKKETALCWDQCFKMFSPQKFHLNHVNLTKE